MDSIDNNVGRIDNITHSSEALLLLVYDLVIHTQSITAVPVCARTPHMYQCKVTLLHMRILVLTQHTSSS
jgi:hypothetical protein